MVSVGNVYFILFMLIFISDVYQGSGWDGSRLNKSFSFSSSI